jgi:hypothetical protein
VAAVSLCVKSQFSIIMGYDTESLPYPILDLLERASSYIERGQRKQGVERENGH